MCVFRFFTLQFPFSIAAFTMKMAFTFFKFTDLVSIFIKAALLHCEHDLYFRLLHMLILLHLPVLPLSDCILHYEHVPRFLPNRKSNYFRHPDKLHCEYEEQSPLFHKLIFFCFLWSFSLCNSFCLIFFFYNRTT